MSNRRDTLRGLESDVDRMIDKASRHKLELVVYILTMAKLELASQIGEPAFPKKRENKRAPFIQ